MSAFDRAQAMYDAAEPDDIEEEGAMNAETVAASLSELVSELTYLDAEDVAATFSAEVAGFMSATVRAYGEGGYLTRDAGFVITLEDGSEYQITVVRSR
jgi:hypothetical protein